jgi:hypothetical protein
MLLIGKDLYEFYLWAQAEKCRKAEPAQILIGVEADLPKYRADSLQRAAERESPRAEEARNARRAASTFRPLIVPQDKTSIAPTHSGCRLRVESPETDSAKTNAKRGRQPRNYSWAQLMMRVFELDVLCCPRCGGRMKILCAINPPPKRWRPF